MHCIGSLGTQHKVLGYTLRVRHLIYRHQSPVLDLALIPQSCQVSIFIRAQLIKFNKNIFSVWLYVVLH